MFEMRKSIKHHGAQVPKVWQINNNGQSYVAGSSGSRIAVDLFSLGFDSGREESTTFVRKSRTEYEMNTMARSRLSNFGR